MEQAKIQVKVNMEPAMREALALRAIEEDTSISALIRRAVRLTFFADAQSKNQSALLVAKDGHKC